MGEPVIPERYQTRFKLAEEWEGTIAYCSEVIELLKELGTAEAKVAEQATVIEQLTKGIKQYKDVRDRFGEYSANEILFPESDAALSK